MRIATIEHVPFEGPANIAVWASSRGHHLDRRLLHAGHALPEPGEFDLLAVMGGPMSVHDELEFPWLADEKRCVKQAVARGRSVLGVCLGAQLLAEVLGGHVTKNAQREIGWHPLSASPWAAASPLMRGIPARFTGFHWHGETFSLPKGATLLAASEACAHQAFGVGGKLAGLQFHFETTAESMEALIAHCGDEMDPGPFTQDADTLRRLAPSHLPELEAMLFTLLDNMAREA
ncbi:GMP synthase [glutamine-hydrolyzing] [Fundidesulfovibrio magnetotacticus]|uniref:GMP synthase [glutamine-hydrolyzing] n=1 Tax=Fundidesulfovibrio magnetotacticus TaxID=2730080 RepID=A0A6V8LQG1_9BACT|nr:type 1 glutamine amidotransferase [Fundidesulfovibrio magnetotacticus]GFK93964.1 GMP synthase [glutamine-hydrolyzing] [Fundidesulfovibrio magnetotacticus]